MGAGVTTGPTTPYPLLTQGGESSSWFLCVRRLTNMSNCSSLVTGHCFLESMLHVLQELPVFDRR